MTYKRLGCSFSRIGCYGLSLSVYNQILYRCCCVLLLLTLLIWIFLLYFTGVSDLLLCILFFILFLMIVITLLLMSSHCPCLLIFGPKSYRKLWYIRHGSRLRMRRKPLFHDIKRTWLQLLQDWMLWAIIGCLQSNITKMGW